MNKLSLALVALALSAPATAASQDVAPAVKRKPAPAVSTAPTAPAASAPSTAPAAPKSAARNSSERQIQAALTAALPQGGGDAALDASLIRVMSSLLAAGQCREATLLATRDGRKELASRAQQFCR